MTASPVSRAVPSQALEAVAAACSGCRLESIHLGWDETFWVTVLRLGCDNQDVSVMAGMRLIGWQFQD